MPHASCPVPQRQQCMSGPNLALASPRSLRSVSSSLTRESFRCSVEKPSCGPSTPSTSASELRHTRSISASQSGLDSQLSTPAGSHPTSALRTNSQGRFQSTPHADCGPGSPHSNLQQSAASEMSSEQKSQSQHSMLTGRGLLQSGASASSNGLSSGVYAQASLIVAPG
eukprot:392330-Pleurochrysis_carterae.AAC.1